MREWDLTQYKNYMSRPPALDYIAYSPHILSMTMSNINLPPMNETNTNGCATRLGLGAIMLHVDLQKFWAKPRRSFPH